MSDQKPCKKCGMIPDGSVMQERDILRAELAEAERERDAYRQQAEQWNAAQITPLEAERDAALAAQHAAEAMVAVLRSLVENLRIGEGCEYGTPDFILADTASAAAAFTARVRRERDAEWCDSLTATCDADTIERITRYFNEQARSDRALAAAPSEPTP